MNSYLKKRMKEEWAKPKLAIFKMTTQCNMSCAYCYQHQNGKIDMTDVYSDEVMDAIIEDMKVHLDEKTDLSIIGGEISLFGDKVETIINKIVASGMKMNSLCIVSNGTFNSEFIDILERLDISFLPPKRKPRLVISIDCNERLHNTLRARNGFGKYEDVKRNINLSQERLSHKFTIITSSVIDFAQLSNIDEIDLVDEGIDINHRRKNLIPIYKTDFTKHDFDLHNELCKRLGDSMINILESKDVDGSNIMYGLQGLDILHLKDILFENMLEKRTCDIGYLRSYLPDGSVTNCHQMISVKTDGTDKYIAGHVLDSNVVDLTEVMNTHIQSTSPCVTCKYNGLCQGACIKLDGKNNCIPWRRAQATNMFGTWKRVLSIPGFWDKYKSFVFKLNSETDGIYDYIESFIRLYEPLIIEMVEEKFGVKIG